MGVADIARTSTVARNFFNFSLCSTPNLCSSSTMISPRSRNFISSESNRWVPITTSIVPVSKPDKVSDISFAVLKRDKELTFIGNPEYRSVKVARCCCTNRVVGTNTATCFAS